MSPTRALTLAGAWLFCACQPPTAILVEVSTDVPCGDPRASHVATTIAVGHLADIDQRPPVATTTQCEAATGRIGSLVLVPGSSDNEEVAIRVVTGIDRTPDDCAATAGASAQGCITARRALNFLPHETIDLPIAMAASCAGIMCSATETCVDGACVQASLPDPSSCGLPQGCGGSAGSPDAGAVPDGGPTTVAEAGQTDAGSLPADASTPVTDAVAGPADAGARVDSGRGHDGGGNGGGGGDGNGNGHGHGGGG